MDLQIVSTTESDAPTFRRLLQLYAYDFSEILSNDIGVDGVFVEKDVASFWRDPLRHPFLLKIKGQLAGLLIIDERSRLWPDEPANDVAEFFVMRKYRRQRVGTRAAAHAFDMFRGRWEVRQLLRNTPATAFWRKAIGEYSGGNFQEFMLDDERWHGPVQIFDNRTLSPKPDSATLPQAT